MSRPDAHQAEHFGGGKKSRLICKLDRPVKISYLLIVLIFLVFAQY